MTMFQTLYLPIGVPTFDLTAAGKVFEASAALLRAVDAETAVPQEMLLGLDKLNAFTEDKCPDLVVLQNVTFANGAYTAEVLRRSTAPSCSGRRRSPPPIPAGSSSTR